MSQSGAFEVWLERQVLVARVEGMWDIDTAQQFSHAIKNAAQPLLIAKVSWAHLVFLDQWELGTPAIEQEIHQLCGWMTAFGMTHAANVFTPHALKQFQLDRMLEPDNLNYDRRAFDNELSARHWLAHYGYAAE